MKRKSIIILIAAFTTLLIACEKEIKFDEDLIAPKLVVNSFIYPDSTMDVKVYASHPIPGVESQSPWISNAKVVLFVDGVQTEELVYSDILDPNPYSSTYNKPVQYLSGYKSITRCEIGKTYKLEVSHPDYKDVSCETSVPAPMPINRIDTITELKYYDSGHSDKWLGFDCVFTDDQKYTNYYRLEVVIWTGITYPSKYDPITGDPLSFVVEIRKEASYLDTEDPLIYPESVDDFLFSSARNNYNLFTDELINGKEYKLHFKIGSWQFSQFDYYMEQDPNNNNFIAVEVKIHTLSRDTYWYLNSIQKEDNSEGLGILTEPVPIYTNVKNGVGIFGGSSTSQNLKVIRGEFPKAGVDYEYQKVYYN